ncbi:MAG: hypothetical protein K2M97_00675, partial [Muribaculaceae bacterium]|nr:hypothetical protein [Muribaculaceae bacterium]
VNPVHYTAVFSPNLDKDISELMAVETTDMKVYVGADKVVRVSSAEPVSHIIVFAVNGEIAASCAGSSTLSLGGLQSGIYVVKAVGTTGAATAKIIL